MKVEASVGGGPWGPWYEVRSEGDLVVWSTAEGGDELQEAVEPGCAGRSLRFTSRPADTGPEEI